MNLNKLLDNVMENQRLIHINVLKDRVILMFADFADSEKFNYFELRGNKVVHHNSHHDRANK